MVVPPTAAEAGDLVAKYLVENGAGDLHAQAAMSGLSWALRTFERPYWAGLVESSRFSEARAYLAAYVELDRLTPEVYVEIKHLLKHLDDAAFRKAMGCGAHAEAIEALNRLVDDFGSDSHPAISKYSRALRKGRDGLHGLPPLPSRAHCAVPPSRLGCGDAGEERGEAFGSEGIVERLSQLLPDLPGLHEAERRREETVGLAECLHAAEAARQGKATAEAQMAALTEKQAALMAQLQSLQEESARSRQRLAERDALVAERDASIAERDASLARARDELAALHTAQRIGHRPTAGHSSPDSTGVPPGACRRLPAEAAAGKPATPSPTPVADGKRLSSVHRDASVGAAGKKARRDSVGIAATPALATTAPPLLAALEWVVDSASPSAGHGSAAHVRDASASLAVAAAGSVRRRDAELPIEIAFFEHVGADGVVREDLLVLQRSSRVLALEREKKRGAMSVPAPPSFRALQMPSLAEPGVLIPACNACNAEPGVLIPACNAGDAARGGAAHGDGHAGCASLWPSMHLLRKRSRKKFYLFVCAAGGVALHQPYALKELTTDSVLQESGLAVAKDAVGLVSHPKDSNLVAVRCASAQVLVCNINLKGSQYISLRSPAQSVVFAPNGRWLIVATSARLCAYNVPRTSLMANFTIRDHEASHGAGTSSAVAASSTDGQAAPNGDGDTGRRDRGAQTKEKKKAQKEAPKQAWIDEANKEHRGRKLVGHSGPRVLIDVDLVDASTASTAASTGTRADGLAPLLAILAADVSEVDHYLLLRAGQVELWIVDEEHGEWLCQARRGDLGDQLCAACVVAPPEATDLSSTAPLSPPLWLVATARGEAMLLEHGTLSVHGRPALLAPPPMDHEDEDRHPRSRADLVSLAVSPDRDGDGDGILAAGFSDGSVGTYSLAALMGS